LGTFTYATFPECEHERKEKRRRVTRAGAETVGWQCLRCGTCTEGVPKRTVRNPWELPAWDKALEEAWSRLRDEFYAAERQRYEQHRADQDREFWERYERHLQSPKWRLLRRKVFERSRGLCEGCGMAPAEHVHHLTYERLGDEMLFDLAAVCNTCHEKIHGRPIGRQPRDC
jgi:hypothetical protein